MVYVKSITEVRRSWSQVLDQVEDGDVVVVEKHGAPVAALVPLDLYARLLKYRTAQDEDELGTAPSA